MEKVAIIGASRGLGAQLLRAVPATIPILAVARNEDRLSQLQKKMGAHVQICAVDVTKDFDKLLTSLRTFQPTRIFYLAGGGPHGDFQKKAWKDHVWAWEVTFLAVARLIHALLNDTPPQIILCGSAVAESDGDAKASSYASAKHALKGLFESLRLENQSVDVRLFSPGYLDTELLPKDALVRYKGVWNPEIVARKLWDWSCTNDRSGHMLMSIHP
jgi:short-subunit dehydrogenase